MKSERSIRWLACRWCLVAVLALFCSLLSAAEAQAQVQTFFVNVPAVSEQRDAMELCRDRFTAALVRVGGFRANQDAVTQQSVTDCLGETASATAKRECEVSMANIEVDFLILPTVRRLGEQWNWSIKALSPAQGAAQVWGGDGSSVEADASKAAYGACESLAKEFACAQGEERACVSIFGSGPVLGVDETAGAAPPDQVRPRRVSVSALDVFDTTPTEVAVWIDGKAAGTSANQVTGIPPGEHEVTLKATGYFDQSQRVVFEAGKRQVIRGIVLRKTTAALSVSMAEPERAVVLVAGRERGISGELLTGIAPGETEVVIRAAGYRDRRESVTFVADTTAKLESLRLESLPATLLVTANVLGAEVLVDGEVVGETTGEEDQFEAPHTAEQVTLRLEGYRPFSKAVQLTRGGQEQIVVNLVRETVAPRAPAAPQLVQGMEPSQRPAPPEATLPRLQSTASEWSAPGVEEWLLFSGALIGGAGTIGVVRACGWSATCNVSSDTDGTLVNAMRFAAWGGYSLAAAGLTLILMEREKKVDKKTGAVSPKVSFGLLSTEVRFRIDW